MCRTKIKISNRSHIRMKLEVHKVSASTHFCTLRIHLFLHAITQIFAKSLTCYFSIDVNGDIVKNYPEKACKLLKALTNHIKNRDYRIFSLPLNGAHST